MKAKEVKIGCTYRIQMSGKPAQARITGKSPHGGWDAINPATNRKIRIKSPARLKYAIRDAHGKPLDVTTRLTPAAANADKAPHRSRPLALADRTPAITPGEIGEATGKADAEKVDAAAADAETVKQVAVESAAWLANGNAQAEVAKLNGAAKAKGVKARAKKQLGCLDAAVEVLKAESAGAEGMTAEAIVKLAMDRGLWTTKGQTPGATLYSAIIREIATKGEASRFIKVAKGRFALAR